MRKTFLSCFFISNFISASEYFKSDIEKRNALFATLDHLFPNVSSSIQRTENKRELSDCYDCTIAKCTCPKCVKCSAMSVCTALIGHLIEEVYYPDNLEYKETCKVLDELGERTQSAIFGNGRTFRDTIQCRGRTFMFYFL